MPNEPGVVLVMIQHLEPTKKSLTTELLAKHTKMQATWIGHVPQERPNRVYVIPPGKYLSIARGKLPSVRSGTNRVGHAWPLIFFSAHWLRISSNAAWASSCPARVRTGRWAARPLSAGRISHRAGPDHG